MQNIVWHAGQDGDPFAAILSFEQMYTYGGACTSWTASLRHDGSMDGTWHGACEGEFTAAKTLSGTAVATGVTSGTGAPGRPGKPGGACSGDGQEAAGRLDWGCGGPPAGMEQLLALGFSADQSRVALQECDGDMQQAVHLILSRETPGTPGVTAGQQAAAASEPEPEPAEPGLPEGDADTAEVRQLLAQVQEQRATLIMLKGSGLAPHELRSLVADITQAEHQLHLAMEAEARSEAKLIATRQREAEAAAAAAAVSTRAVPSRSELVSTSSARRRSRRWDADSLERASSAPVRQILDALAASNPRFEDFDFAAASEWQRHYAKAGSRDAGQLFWHNTRTKESTWVNAPTPQPVEALERYKQRHPRVEDRLRDMPQELAQELIDVGVIRDQRRRHILYRNDSHPVDALIKTCSTHGLRFCDPSFPAAASSLNSDHWPVHSWRRAADLHYTPALFSQAMAAGSEITDSIVQGALGDCWLLSALASVSAGDESRVRELFYPCRYNPFGCYAVRMWVDGEECWVLVDDQIPCGKEGRPIFSRPRDGREIWVLLMEKAFAKVQGSYKAIDAGLSRVTSDSALIMTSMAGGISARIKRDADSADLFDVAKTILKCGLGGGAMVLSCNRDDAAGKKALGLVAHHAYSVIDAGGGQPWANGLHFLRLRNPWGKREWNGPWSDLDIQRWAQHPELDRRLRRDRGYGDGGNDGAFWMELSDVRRHFSNPCWCWFSEHLYLPARSKMSPFDCNIVTDQRTLILRAYSTKAPCMTEVTCSLD